MSGPNRIHLPGGRAGAPDPNAATLWTCTDCGHQMLVPQVVVQVVAEQHLRGCLAPRLAELKALLTGRDEGT